MNYGIPFITISSYEELNKSKIVYKLYFGAESSCKVVLKKTFIENLYDINVKGLNGYNFKARCHICGNFNIKKQTFITTTEIRRIFIAVEFNCDKCYRNEESIIDGDII